MDRQLAKIDKHLAEARLRLFGKDKGALTLDEALLLRAELTEAVEALAGIMAYVPKEGATIRAGYGLAAERARRDLERLR